MKDITLEELLEAGCHFGHQLTRQNPKAREYVFEARDGIHIINLGLTKKGLDEAAAFIKELAEKPGSTLVLVGSKRQAQPIVIEEVKKAKQVLGEKKIIDGLYSVTSRWIGGTLTNAPEVRKNYKKLKDLSAKLKDEFEKSKYTKKEIGLWDKERQKLEMFYGGIVELNKQPDALFIIDTHLENLAVMEASRTGVSTVGIVDTNADPDIIDYPIPANDDAVGSIQLIVSYIIDAWIEGKQNAAKEESKRAEKIEGETGEANQKKVPAASLKTHEKEKKVDVKKPAVKTS